VIGIGGLGHMAVQILRAISAAQVIAVDIDERKLALAREVGADQAVHSGGDAAAQIRDLTHGLGVTVVLDFVGTDTTMALAATVTRPAGEVTVVGLAGGAFPFRFGALPFDCAITVPYWGSAVELMEVLTLARQGTIRARVQRFPLSQVADVYQQLREGKIDGRAVITPPEP
jgi:propanol-preferring alcohol dehydrogenase